MPKRGDRRPRQHIVAGLRGVYSGVRGTMRRLSMRNKRRKSETMSGSESEENGGNVDNGKDETQKTAAAGRNNHNATSETATSPAMRKSAMKRRSRGTAQQKHADNSGDVKDELKEELEERENGEKTKPSPNKRKRKEDQKASTSAREETGEENEYEVDMIVGHRTIKGRRQFLIRWKGYSNASDSWENEKDLSCPKLIEEFLASEKESKPAKTKTTKTDKSKKARGSSKKQTEHEDLDVTEEPKEKESLKEFEVERIIEVHFKKNGKREFLIRWKGFSATDDTWEPEENLNCPELINKFMQKLEKMKTADLRELRTNRAHTKRYTLSTRDSGRRLSRRHMDKQRWSDEIVVK
ncbi:probable chromo domain-containing protein LHP1 isoform X3 [Odontomachus brunneus]|uniref:probable chromo domain-containing protein LHP1 isoform X3 n=1 Tax=Odontomachus brunneus TaxID=486640 RepID=UPI0013F1A5FD|nr:probable chromo domain-containing protein LHP1 isoform X3 [Odontomachus brunneus]